MRVKLRCAGASPLDWLMTIRDARVNVAYVTMYNNRGASRATTTETGQRSCISNKG